MIRVRHPGPVWLDRVKTDSLAPYGFGAELRRAVEQRREALRRLGVQPDDPNRSAKLRELEQRAAGGQIAARSRQVFLPSAPDGFRGRVQLADAGPSGPSYAVVSDGQRFIMLRATATLRASLGKAVTVTRDAKGRLLVGPARALKQSPTRRTPMRARALAPSFADGDSDGGARTRMVVTELEAGRRSPPSGRRVGSSSRQSDPP